MSTLDSPNIGDPKASFMPYALRFGVIGGIVSIIMSLIITIAGSSASPMTFGILAMVIGLFSLVITAIIAARSVKGHRDNDLGGYITFGNAFKVAFVTLMIASLISGVFSFIYYSFIDPTFGDTMAAKMADMMQEMGSMDEAAVDAQVERMKKGFTPAQQLKNMLWTPLGAAIFGVIVGAITKRDKPFS
jgi:Protein of unknown function (DUF4199)